MSVSTEKEAQPKQIFNVDLDEEEWLYVKEGWARLPRGTDLSLGRFREWCNEQKHGIVSGVFGGRLMIRADTIPKILPID